MVEETVKFLDHAAYLFPESFDIPRMSAQLLRFLQRWNEAGKQYEIAEKLAENQRPEILNARFYFDYASAIERGGDIKRAEKLFKHSIELHSKADPEFADKKFAALLYNYLGYMWLENDMNIDEAGELIKTAYDLDPESGAITDSIGWFYFKKGRYADAKRELLRARVLMQKEAQERGRADEADPVILDHIGQALFHLGEKEEAIRYLEQAVETAPDEKEYTDRLKEYRADIEKKSASKKETPPAPKNDANKQVSSTENAKPGN